MEKTTKSAGGSLAARRVFAYIVLILLSILCLFAFYILIVNATRSHSEIGKGFSALPGTRMLTNLRNLMSDANLPVFTGLRNSLLVAACSAALSVYFSALTAYAIHCYDFKGRNIVFTFILLIMTIPTQVTALGFINLMDKFKMMDTFWPLILPSVAAPAVFFFMKQYMDGALPIEIVEAARIDGSNEFGTFNRIVLPIMKPAFAVQAIFAFVTSWNNYFTPALILKKNNLKTLPILIAQLRSADFLKFDMGKVYMMIFLSILPVVVVYLFLSKYIIQGVALGSVKG